ncbi:synaptic vesicle 2-related protein-like [Cydia fagiglandana]|uniref:synaptic vesicle 2-related protein-like n=1 Tax=Cydia fagiglandana TaxID=1458189 RepID=UPI002FEDEA0A
MGDIDSTTNGSVCEKIPDEKCNGVSESDKTPFEDALKIIGTGTYNYRLLTIVIYSLLAATAEVFTIGVVTTAAQCDLGLDVEKKGLMSSIPILGVVVSAHFWGFLADTRGRRFALIISTSACCVAGLLAAFASSWIYLAVIKFIGAIFGVNLLLIVFFTFESPKFYFAVGEHEMGLKIMQKFYKMNTGNALEEYPVKYVVLNKDDYKARQRNFFRSIWEQTTPLFSKKHIKSTVLIFLCGLPSYCVAPPLSIWLPFIMNSFSKSENNIQFCDIFRMKTITNDNSSVIPECDDRVADITYITLSTFAAYLVFCSLSTCLVIKYIGKKWTFVINHFVCAVLCVMINYLNMLGGVVALVGLSANVSCMGIVTTYAIELFPTYMRAMAVCLTILCGRAVSIVFSNIIGAQLQNNCFNFIFIVAGLIAFGGFVGIFLPSDRKKKEMIKEDKETNNTT